MPLTSDFFKLKRDGDWYSLFIDEALPEDAGVFTCTATNPAGKMEKSVQVRVRGKKIHNTQLSDEITQFKEKKFLTRDVSFIIYSSDILYHPIALMDGGFSVLPRMDRFKSLKCSRTRDIVICFSN